MHDDGIYWSKFSWRNWENKKIGNGGTCHSRGSVPWFILGSPISTQPKPSWKVEVGVRCIDSSKDARKMFQEYEHQTCSSIQKALSGTRFERDWT